MQDEVGELSQDKRVLGDGGGDQVLIISTSRFLVYFVDHHFIHLMDLSTCQRFYPGYQIYWQATVFNGPFHVGKI